MHSHLRHENKQENTYRWIKNALFFLTRVCIQPRPCENDAKFSNFNLRTKYEAQHLKFSFKMRAKQNYISIEKHLPLSSELKWQGWQTSD